MKYAKELRIPFIISKAAITTLLMDLTLKSIQDELCGSKNVPVGAEWLMAIAPGFKFKDLSMEDQQKNKRQLVAELHEEHLDVLVGIIQQHYSALEIANIACFYLTPMKLKQWIQFVFGHEMKLSEW